MVVKRFATAWLEWKPSPSAISQTWIRLTPLSKDWHSLCSCLFQFTTAEQLTITGLWGSHVRLLTLTLMLMTVCSSNGRSPRSRAAGAELCVWASPPKIRRALTRTACPSTPARTWCRRAASGPRRCPRSSPTRAASSPSGWTRRAASSTASTSPAPCCSSAGCAPLSHSGPSLTSMVSPAGCSCWVS